MRTHKKKLTFWISKKLGLCFNMPTHHNFKKSMVEHKSKSNNFGMNYLTKASKNSLDTVKAEFTRF